MRWLVIIILQLVFMQQAKTSETIGRLFFTPEQRQNLERLRKDRQHDSLITEANANALKLSPSPLLKMKIQGYVERNDDKKSTRWLNGKPLQDDEIE